MRIRPRGCLRWLARAVLIVVGCLVLAEIGLRIVGHRYQSRFWEESAALHGGADRVTILALGESTTAGLWLPGKDSYPKQLERMLRRHYGTDRVEVLIPPHIGQNTSQMVHRYPRYLQTFEPAVVILMAGVNNSWSLAESNLGEFMPQGNWRTWAFRFRRWADGVKVFRLARLLAADSRERWRAMQSDLAGQPHFTSWPPPNDPLVRDIGMEPFLELWRSDVGWMIDEARAAGAAVILMTYPNYETPPVTELVAMSRARSVPLVENHASFLPILEEGRAADFFFEDMRHPNASGYAIVAENAFRAVLESGVLDERLGADAGATTETTGAGR